VPHRRCGQVNRHVPGGGRKGGIIRSQATSMAVKSGQPQIRGSPRRLESQRGGGREVGSETQETIGARARERKHEYFAK